MRLPGLWICLLVVLTKPLWVLPATGLVLLTFVWDAHKLLAYSTCGLLVLGVGYVVMKGVKANARKETSHAANLFLVPFVLIQLSIPLLVALTVGRGLPADAEERARAVNEMVSNLKKI